MAWKIQADGSYVSDQSPFKAYLDGGVWKLQNLNVNDSDFLTFAEMLQFPPFPAGSFPNPYPQNINLQSGKNLQVNGTPVGGFYDDGTPYFVKIVRASMADTVTSITPSHGIANLYSGDRLRALTTATRYIPNNAGYGIHLSNPITSEVFYPTQQVTYNDTLINAQRASGTGQLDLIFRIEYV